ncbi:MAG: ABC transporter permease [Candidatus Asgardarchaeia archaeon]
MKFEQNKVNDVKEKLYELENIKNVIVKRELLREWRSVFAEFMAISYGMLFISAVISGALIFTTITISTIERHYEVATLRILGFKMKKLASIITIENLLMSGLGIILGLIFGYFVTLQYINVLVQEFSGKLFYFELYVNPQDLTTIIIAILLTAVISELPSLRHIAKMNIAKMAKEAVL